MDMLAYAEKQQELMPGIKSGVLNLIPKPGKDSRFLRNMRPITLLNVDYKIIEKALAKKLDTVLPEIIHRDQTGFMKQRRILYQYQKSLRHPTVHKK